MAEYRYQFYDLLTNQLNIELPLYGTWFTRRMNGAGNGTCSYLLDATDLSDDDVIQGTEPGRTKLYVVRDGQIMWSGVPWTRTWQEQSKSFSCTLQTLESLSYMNNIEEDITYTASDQRNILIDLITRMQAKPYFNLGWRLPAAFTNNILRSTSFWSYEGWSFGKAIEYMIKYDQGFDYTVESMWGTDETPWDVVRIGDVLGASADLTNLAFDYPGNVKNFYYSESAAKGGVTTLGYGKGEGSDIVRSKYVSPGYLGFGYPDLQQTFDNKDVSVQATLDSQTKAYGDLRPMPVITPTIELEPDVDPKFGTWSLGDYANLTVESRRFPQGKQISTRIIGWDLRPGTKGSQPESLNLVLDEVD